MKKIFWTPDMIDKLQKELDKAKRKGTVEKLLEKVDKLPKHVKTIEDLQERVETIEAMNKKFNKYVKELSARLFKIEKSQDKKVNWIPPTKVGGDYTRVEE